MHLLTQPDGLETTRVANEIDEFSGTARTRHKVGLPRPDWTVGNARGEQAGGFGYL